MRRVGLMVMVVALVVVESVVPAAAQAEEPRAVVTVSQSPNALYVGANGCYFSPGSPVQITFSGGGGRSREFSRRVGDDTCFAWSPPQLNPCQLGASDLPETQFRVEVEVGDTYGIYEDFTLEPDGAPPRFLAPPFKNASPEPGDQVEAGDEIGFEVTAVENNPPKVWQTGVHTLEVTGPRGPIGRPEQGGANAKACEAKSKSLTIQRSYPVRRSDPAVIELCAVAKDYVPKENKGCEKWYKGEVWEGTFTGTEKGGECVLEVEGTLSLVVAKDGSVTGEGQRTDTDTGSSVGCSNTSVITTVSISGRATDRAFEIFGFTAVDGGPFRIPKSGTRARRDSFVTVQSDPDVYSVELRCVSC